MVFGKVLKKKRLERDLSQEDLAKVFGVTKQNVCNYECDPQG